MNTMSPSGITPWQEFLSGLTSGPPGSASDPGKGATEDELRGAEERLGTSLPPSLRTFLACSNGWRNHDALFGLCSAGELRWTNDAAHDLVDLWCSFEEIIELIAHCLVVLDSGDGRYGLVDAARPTGDGEWTAYAWAAGDGLTPRPFRNFSALVTALVSGDLPDPDPATWTT
jgi:hypothetical protein